MADRLSKVPSRVTVEDLLRLKRAERPPPEFWAEFERELRQRQLAALVERKPWWNGLSMSVGRLSWLRLPVGAMAVLTLTMLSVRQYSDSGGVPPIAQGRKAISGVAMEPVSAAPKSLVHLPAAGSAHAAVAENPVIPTNLASNGTVAATSQVAQREIAALDSRSGEVDNGGLPSERDSLADLLPVQFAAPSPVESVLVDAAARPIGFEDRAISTPRPRRTAEVLPTAVAVTEPRRARLLAALGSSGAYAPEPSAPEHAKRSVIRYLAEDGWDRSMSRLQADGDRLSIRF